MVDPARPADHNEDDGEQLDIHAVAALLHCTIGDVIGYVNAGQLPAYRFQDTVWFHSNDLASLRD